MCLAKAYLKDSTGEPLLKDIASIEVKDGRLLLKTLFGEQKEIEANIQAVDFLKSNIILGGP